MLKKIIAMGVISIMGIMMLCGCNGDNWGVKNDNLVEENADFVELNTWFFTSDVPNNVIETVYNEPGASFELSVDKGKFLFSIDNHYVLFQQATLGPGETIYWTTESDNIIDIAYADVIVKVRNNVIGYAVIKITNPDGSPYNYNATIVKSVAFPKVNGEYQKVTQEQVEKKLPQRKNKKLRFYQ